MVILVFLGPPGAGKGTQAKKLAADRGFAHVSTGEILRSAVAAGTDLGQKVKPLLDAGQYVSDDLMIALIKERVHQPDCTAGVVLDGFPRTNPQAVALEQVLAEMGQKVSQVIYFDVDEAAILARLENRRRGESRTDDDPLVQLERIRVYKEQTLPLVDHYRSLGVLFHVNASGDIATVYSQLLEVLHHAS